MILLVLFCMLVGCRRRDMRLRTEAVSDRAAIPVLEANDVATIISDSGVVRYCTFSGRYWNIMIPDLNYFAFQR